MDFWQHHGIWFIVFMFFFPRLTMLFATVWGGWLWWLGWLLAPTGWPGLRWLSDRGYEWFARNRLAIGKWFGRKCESGKCSGA